MTALSFLRQGARAAAPPAPVAAKYLSFALAGEMFGIDILRVREIIQYSVPDTVPLMPACVRGVINLRGLAVPVMDLTARFGRGQTGVGRRSCIIIVEPDAERTLPVIGVMADAVNEVLEIAPGDITPAPDFGGHGEFLEGMGRLDGRFVLLLNAGRVFSHADIGTAARIVAVNDTTEIMS